MSGTLVDLLVLLGILAIVCVAGWYILQQVNLPEPMRKILMIVLVVVAAIVGIMLLLNLGGIGGHRMIGGEPFRAVSA